MAGNEPSQSAEDNCCREGYAGALTSAPAYARATARQQGGAEVDPKYVKAVLFLFFGMLSENGEPNA